MAGLHNGREGIIQSIISWKISIIWNRDREGCLRKGEENLRKCILGEKKTRRVRIKIIVKRGNGEEKKSEGTRKNTTKKKKKC